MNFNRIILGGHLTRDIELRHTANTTVANFGLACNRKWTTADGERREDVLFVDCAAFGKTAETLAKFFSKGKPILIEGRLRLEQWEDKESGAKRSKHTVTVETFAFAEGKAGVEQPSPLAQALNSRGPSVAAARVAMADDDGDPPF